MSQAVVEDGAAALGASRDSRLRPALRPHLRHRHDRPPAWLTVPAAITAAAMLLPLVYLVVRATGAGGEVLAIVTAPATLRVLGNSALLAFLVTTASAVIAVPLAWLTVRSDLPGRRMWGVLAALPLCIPTFVGGFTFVSAFGPRGMLRSLLAPFGVERLPEIYGLHGAVLVLTLFSYPYLLLTVRGALTGLDPALEEASRSCGVSRWSTFMRVTLPQLRPAMTSGALLVALYALSDFGAVSLLRYDSFTRAIYVQYRSAFDRTPAAVLALALVAFTLVLLAVEARARGRRAAAFQRLGGAPRAAPLVPLGRWRVPALMFCGTVVGVALLVPAGVLVYWLARGLATGEEFRPVAQAAWNSLRASGSAAVVAAAVAVPLAALSVRHPSRLSTVLERGAYVGYALPGIVVALALVFFGARIGEPLYQSLAMLVFAYVVRFLPQSVGATRASLLQVPPALEEASRGLGRSTLATFATVTAPLVRPGVMAGAGLVFLTAMKELPVTLLLAPTGYRTLATAVWSASSEAFFARAAAAALPLVLLSGIPLALLALRRDGLGSGA